MVQPTKDLDLDINGDVAESHLGACNSVPLTGGQVAGNQAGGQNLKLVGEGETVSGKGAHSQSWKCLFSPISLG